MSSELRKESVKWIEHWVSSLPDDATEILDIGIAGDPKPGQNYYLFQDKHYQTADIDPQYGSDYVFDICTPPTTLQSHFNVVILSNTLEHIFDTRAALAGCAYLLKKGGSLIIDIPWQYPYHKSGDSDDYWRISASAMKRLLTESGFSTAVTEQGTYVTTGIARK